MGKNVMQSIAKTIVLINYISSASAYSVRPNIDFYGGDMYPIYGINNSLTCLEYCESIRNCRLLTWCDNTCYIKNKKVSEVEKLDCISIDMYPDDEIINSTTSNSSWDGSGSWSGSGSGSMEDSNTISIDDLITTQPPTSPPTTTPSPSPSPTQENDNTKDANTNSDSAAQKLTFCVTGVLVSILILF
jgi:hypothetical protein